MDSTRDKLSPLPIHCAAVLGAGVMGAQIAAHLTHAGVKTFLFDLPSETGDKNKIVHDSLKALKKLKPAPLGGSEIDQKIIPANYQSDLALLKTCDLVIEVISERLDWKQALYQKIVPFLNEKAIFATNTSGLSIEALSQGLPASIKPRFCGIHFFNPPRYMKLVEIIPHAGTDRALLAQIESFLVNRLGKGVIYAKDTPNFIGNRIGVFALLAVMHHSQELGLPPDIVDALTGPLIGRAKSATFRTMDVVGLDTLSHVVNTLKKELPQDPWSEYFCLPDWINLLVDRGCLGQKSGAGIYKKENKKEGPQIVVYDHNSGGYRPSGGHIDEAVQTIFRQPDLAQRFALLQQSDRPQAQFLWRIYRDVFHYCAYHLENIANTPREIDLAMRWGYGWTEGVFETWQRAGWKNIVSMIEQDRMDHQTLTQAPLPAWAKAPDFEGPYQAGKAYAPHTQTWEGRSSLPVYCRQYFPDHMSSDTKIAGETIFETEGVRMWVLDSVDPLHRRFPIVSFRSKKNTIGVEVLAGLIEAIARAEKEYDGLVLWQSQDQNFSLGANLKAVSQGLALKQFDQAETVVRAFQDTALALRYARVPTVAAIKGLTLGGGCELMMHTSSIIAAFESYIGLVEVGVGLLPAGGGSKELAYRASKQAVKGNLFNALQPYFEQIAMAKVSGSALEAREFNYLQSTDTVLMNADELLYVALRRAQYLCEAGYVPPQAPIFPVVGRAGKANFQAYLVNLREGDFISDHDFLIGQHVAHVLCGGDVDQYSLVTQDWMLGLEREGIMALLRTPQTAERIKYTLEAGKPLRN